MNRTPFSSNVSALESALRLRGTGASHLRDRSPEKIAAEARAKRMVNTVATLRILIPVALITAMVMSGRPVPDAPFDSALAAAPANPIATDVAAHYFPAQYTNRGAGGEEHVQGF